MVKCQVIMDAMEQLAPKVLAEEWDNPGLLLGSPAQKINKIITCLDVNKTVVQTALKENCDMIISHHPFIFHAIKNIRTDLPLGKMIEQLIKHDIAVFAAHTNLDSAWGGINDMLAFLWRLQEIKPLTISFAEKLVKLCVFVPQSHAEAIRTAIGKAGAGFIGNYSHCSFEVSGKGHFLPLEGTHPFIGKIGEIADVDEVQVQTVFPAKIKDRVVKAMLKAHPYEEAAYEIYPLETPGQTTGLGRIGKLKKSMAFEDFAILVKNSLPADNIRIVKGNDKKVQKIALCSGAGAEFINKAKMQGADVYVTGDVKYHEAQKAQEIGLNLIDAGHFGTEFPIAKVLADKLREYDKKDKWHTEIICDELSKDPFVVI